MRVIETSLPGVLLVEPVAVGDARGFFLETFQAQRYADHCIGDPFVQDNISFSSHGILRGLHIQNPQPQGKLVHVLQGEVFDVAVDIRQGSPAFGRWFGAWLSGDNHRQLWLPAGFAHGFCVTSETALVGYKCTDYYNRDMEMSLRWDDPFIGIHWPLEEPVLSDKDALAPRLDEIEVARLPIYR